MFRPISNTDYSRVKHIAHTIGGFSEPTDYMLWMLSETQNEFSFVYTDEYTEEVLGYVLCLRMVDQTQNNIFCWQLGGMANSYCSGAYIVDQLFSHLSEMAIKNEIDNIYFTCEDRRRKRVGGLFKYFLNKEIEIADSYPNPKEKGIEEQMYFVEVPRDKTTIPHTYH